MIKSTTIKKSRHNPFFRVISGKMLVFSDDSESGGIRVENGNGQLITHKEAVELYKGMIKFIRYYGDKQIQEFNDELTRGQNEP